MKRLLAILLCVCLMFTLVACAGKPTQAQQDAKEEAGSTQPEEKTNASAAEETKMGESVLIGCILPLSGSSAFDGESAMNGAKTAAQYINDNGGILGGRKIELVVEDSATDPDTAASAAEKLINSDHVVALIGAFNSSCTAAVMPIAKRNGIPLVTAIATSATLTEQDNEWFFRAVGISKLYIGAFAETVINTLGANKIAYIYENGDWGLGSVNTFKEFAEGLGAETTTTQVVNSSDADLYTQLTAIKDTNPDAIYAVSNLANAVRIATQAKELGITCPIIGEGAWASGDFLDQAGDAAEGIYGMVEYLPDIKTEMNPLFTELYAKQTNGKTPDKYCACDFNAVLVVANAIDQAGSTDAAAVRDALAATDMDILTGHIQFNANGQGYGFETFLSKNVNGVATFAGSATVVAD